MEHRMPLSSPAHPPLPSSPISRGRTCEAPSCVRTQMVPKMEHRMPKEAMSSGSARPMAP
eukprot:10463-Pyramimonas_sp.AAC.1